MRGTIIMWSGEKGVITAGGQRYDFDINNWQGAVAPAANMTVEITVADGKLDSVTPVNEADLAKEKLSAMTGKGGEVAKAVFANVGMDVAIAYGVFLVFALFIGVNSSGGIMGCSITLANMLSGLAGMMSACMGGGGSGKGIFLVLLATATIAVPYFWKHKFAPLAFLAPLLITLIAVKPVWDQYREAKRAAEAMAAQMAEFARAFGQMAQQEMPDSPGMFDNAGLGAYVIIAAVLYLAFKGVMKTLGRA